MKKNPKSNFSQQDVFCQVSDRHPILGSFPSNAHILTFHVRPGSSAQLCSCQQFTRQPSERCGNGRRCAAMGRAKAERERREQETDGEGSGKEGRSSDLSRSQQKKHCYGKSPRKTRAGWGRVGLSGWITVSTNFTDIITHEKISLLSPRDVFFHDRVFTDKNCFQVASRKVTMSHAVVVQFAFLLPAENVKLL